MAGLPRRRWILPGTPTSFRLGDHVRILETDPASVPWMLIPGGSQGVVLRAHRHQRYYFVRFMLPFRDLSKWIEERNLEACAGPGAKGHSGGFMVIDEHDGCGQVLFQESSHSWCCPEVCAHKFWPKGGISSSHWVCRVPTSLLARAQTRLLCPVSEQARTRGRGDKSRHN
jgi:hypothetical protein